MKYIKKYNEDINWEFDYEEENNSYKIFKVGGDHFLKQDDNHVFKNFPFKKRNFNSKYVYFINTYELNENHLIHIYDKYNEYEKIKLYNKGFWAIIKLKDVKKYIFN